MNYQEVVWSYAAPKVRQKNVLYITNKDVNHLSRIYKKFNIEPESISKVTIKFLSDREKLLRFIIKELDVLLNVGGQFLIESTFSPDHGKFIRSIDQVRHEFSISTNNRYRNIDINRVDNKVLIKYDKTAHILPDQDRIDRWSFGVITDGRKSQQVSNIIESIKLLKIPSFEIIICGEYEVMPNTSNVIVLDDIENHEDIRAPICKKKNKIAHAAKYNNLMIIHDRYIFPLNWYIQMEKYGNFFELLSMPNLGPKQGRVSDWNVFSIHPSGTRRFDLILPKYTSWSPWWYAQGGVLIVKRSMFLENALDERLHWGELEDIQFSQIGSLKGWFYYFDINNNMNTESLRLPESKTSTSNVLYVLKLVRASFYSGVQVFKNIIQHYKNRNS
jgi:hypothetical protein